MEQQRTKEWFEKRKGRVTGSNIGAILGINKSKSPENVMREMVRAYHDAPKEFEGNILTEYGVENEPCALEAFKLLNPSLTVEETGFHISDERNWIGASPDGLIDSNAVLEIKCPFGKRNRNDFLPLKEQPSYYAQVQFEMYCTKRNFAYFFQWSKEGYAQEIVKIDMNWINKAIPKLEKFYERFMIEISNTDHLIDKKQVTEIGDDDEHAKETAETYKSAYEQLKYYKGIVDESKKELIAIAKGNKSKICGLTVYPTMRKATVNYKAVVEKLLPDVDLSEYMSEPTESWSVR